MYPTPYTVKKPLIFQALDYCFGPKLISELVLVQTEQNYAVTVFSTLNMDKITSILQPDTPSLHC